MPSTTASLALAAAAVLASAASAVPTGLSRGCVLDASGQEVCTRFADTFSLGMGFASLARQSTGGSTVSYCNAGVDITNEIRARHGKSGKVVAGTQSMLDNAVKHSKDMSETSMEHQNLGAASAEVGCGVFINRENIAMFGGMDKDPAVQCMDQWEKSAGHLENILGAEDGDYVAVGVYKSGNEWWCTQTFGKPGGGNCPMIGQSSGAGSSPTGAPATVEPKKTPLSFQSGGGTGDGASSPPTTEAPVVSFIDSSKNEPRTTVVSSGNSFGSGIPNDMPKEESLNAVHGGKKKRDCHGKSKK
jgi:hypothetical protein